MVHVVSPFSLSALIHSKSCSIVIKFMKSGCSGIICLHHAMKYGGYHRIEVYDSVSPGLYHTFRHLLSRFQRFRFNQHASLS